MKNNTYLPVQVRNACATGALAALLPIALMLVACSVVIKQPVPSANSPVNSRASEASFVPPASVFAGGPQAAASPPKDSVAPKASASGQEAHQHEPTTGSEHAGNLDHAAAPAADDLTYTCPMHPEIHLHESGNCPKCGMTLEMEMPEPGDPR